MYSRYRDDREYYPRHRGGHRVRDPYDTPYKRPAPVILDLNVSEYIPAHSQRQQSFRGSYHSGHYSARVPSQYTSATMIASTEARAQSRSKDKNAKDLKFVELKHLSKEVFEGNVLSNLGVLETDLAKFNGFPEQKRIEMLFKQDLDAKMTLRRLEDRFKPKMGISKVELYLLTEKDFKMRTKHVAIIDHDETEISKFWLTLKGDWSNASTMNMTGKSPASQPLSIKPPRNNRTGSEISMSAGN